MILSFKKFNKEQRQGLTLLFTGVFLIVIFLGWRFHQKRTLSFSRNYPTETDVSTNNKDSKPIYINIPAVGVKLLVEEAHIVGDIWEISYDAASHLNKSANLSEDGNVVIYGHNRNSLFGPIRWLSEGDLIEVTSEEDGKYTFKVAKTFITTPDDIQYVLPKETETLTLYTCTGFLDSKRHIVIAEPVEN